jgi:lipopolysaccharide export system ATP-binding protein
VTATGGDGIVAGVQSPDPGSTALPLLEVKDLAKTYRRRRVVDGVSFAVEPGEIVGLLGPNGAGKTTTFRMTLGLVPPDAGTVEIRGEDVTGAPVHVRARRGLGYLPQEASVFRRMTVEDNILAVLEALSLSSKERRERCDARIEEFGLGKVRGSLAETLSGGERRRLEIARALALEPALLLLDEPFSGIDPIAVEDIQGLLAGLRRRGIGLVITDHNVRETLSITDRAYIIYAGRIAAHGPPAALVEDEFVRKIYLGSRFELGSGPPPEGDAAGA